MSSKTTRLTPSHSPLPTITPHLMPFHVAHTGAAPLSTYFIIKPALQPDTTDSAGPSLIQRAKARFVSAFRGRKMQGLSVILPDGYGGVVLETEGLGTTKGKDAMTPKRLASAKPKGQKGRRATRRSTRGNPEGVDEDGDVMVGETLEEENVLLPTAKFSSFTLWNADVDVDEGRDEYLRALSEYQQLLAQIHRIDP